MVESLATLRETEKLKKKAGVMGAMEQVTGEGDETDANSKKGEAAEISNTMRRAASIDDLFAPMYQLNVQTSAAAPSSSHQNASTVLASSSSVKSQVPAPHHHTSRIAAGGASVSALPADRKEASALAGGRTNDTGLKTVPVNSRTQKNEGLKRTVAEKVLEGSSSSHSSEPEVADVKPSATAPGTDQQHGHPTPRNERKGAAGKTNSGEAVDPLPPSNSTSDDDHAGGIDERKQKRMLSNRESARRSRLRKQQHLDELRAQVAHLRAENNHMMTKYSIASQRYDYLTKENRELRSHAMALTAQLQRLHQTAAQHHGGLRALGLQPSHLDPAPYGSNKEASKADPGFFSRAGIPFRAAVRSYSRHRKIRTETAVSHASWRLRKELRAVYIETSYAGVDLVLAEGRSS
ncbi:hypothetical protein R1flu_003653 [Riccia fluitans]|uniref:BZIP domain-containing protein n=1 Tax=Riccia fluitans TaxID=41844 RepID=A0ABD1Y9R7_9MARC